MLESELVGEIRGGIVRLVGAVGYQRAAWALGGISASSLRRFCEASPPKPVRPATRKAIRPAASGALERFELLEPVRLLVGRGIEAYGQRATARAIGGVSAAGIAKFAQSNSLVYSGTWRRVLAWYDASVKAGPPPLDSNAISNAIAALVRDLAPDVAGRISVELRAIVDEAFRLQPVVVPLVDVKPTRAARARVVPGDTRIRHAVPTSTMGPPVAPAKVLPGRRPARFRAGMLLGRRAVRT